jgi:GTP-binding protein HflX
VLLTDTVGFINNLPTMLVAAFRATLEEINEASVLVHVLDVTHPNAVEQATTVNAVLEDLGADDKPVVLALNKVDALGPNGLLGLDSAFKAALIEAVGPELFANAVPISAQTGEGVERLLAKVEETLETEADYVSVRLYVPFDRQALVERFHSVGRVEDVSYDEHGTIIRGSLPRAFVGRFEGLIHVLPRGIPDGRTNPGPASISVAAS